MTSRALVRTSSALSVTRAGTLLLQAAHFALVARLLPPDRFAGFAAALALVMIATALAEFGLTHTTVLALHRRPGEEARTLGEAVTANVLLVPGAIALTAPVALLALPEDGRLAYLLLIPSFALSALQLPFVAYRRHQLQFRRLVTAEVMTRGLPVVVLAPVLAAARDWPATSQLAAVGGSLAAGALVGLAVLVAPAAVGGGAGHLAAARRLLASATPLGLTSALSMIHVRVDQLVLSGYGIRAGLAAYAVAYRVFDAALVVVGGAAAASFPMLARADGRDRASLARVQAAFLGAVAVVLGVGAFAFAPQLTALIGGDRYREAAWLVRLLSAALVVSVLNMGAAQIAVVEGRARSLLRIAAWGVGCNLVLNLLLVGRYGVRAAALATVATELGGFVLVCRLARRALADSQPVRIPVVTLGAFLVASFGALVAWRHLNPPAGVAVAVAAVGAALVALWREAVTTPRAPAVRPKVAQVITKMTLGGAQETALRYCRVDPDRFDTVLVTGPDRDGEADLRRWADLLGVRLVTVPSLRRPIRPLADVAAVVSLVKLFRREQVDIVHTHSSKAGLVGRMAAWLAGVPTVLHTVHGWSFHDGMAPSVRGAIVLLERFAARLTSRIIVVGQADRRAGLSASIGRPEQYVLIRSAIELEEYRRHAGVRHAARAELGIPAGAPLVGTVTRLYPQKDPLALVEVAAAVAERLPEARLVVVGDGPLRPDVERAIAERALGSQVLLMGWRRDIPALVASFDVFLSTSRWEGLPRTVVEAAAAEVPIVATDVGSTGEIVRDGDTGLLVAPGDVRAMAAAVVRLLEDRPLARRFAEAAAVGLAEFAVAAMVPRLAEAYDGLPQASHQALEPSPLTSSSTWSAVAPQARARSSSHAESPT